MIRALADVCVPVLVLNACPTVHARLLGAEILCNEFNVCSSDRFLRKEVWEPNSGGSRISKWGRDEVP